MGFLIEKSGIIWKSLLNCCKYTKGMLYTSYEIYQITKNKQGGKGMFKKVVSAIMVAAMVGTMVAPVSVSAKDGGKTMNYGLAGQRALTQKRQARK